MPDMRLAGFSAAKSTVITATTFDDARGVYIVGAGNIIGKLLEDTADRTFSGLVAGTVYPFAIKSITSATATGFVLH
jgi:hypothetical protein